MKKLLLILLLIFVLAGVFLVRDRIPRSDQPLLPDANVLLITIDTIRPDHITCYGGSNPTPNIDKVASDGVLFQNAFCQVPLTFPSHVSILTGLFPATHGVHNNGLEVFQKKELLLPVLLQKHGYKTGAVVSSFVLDRKFGLAGGFAEYDDRMERHPSIRSNFEVERPGDNTVNAARRMIDGWKSSKWFCWLHFYDPHTPYLPPEPWEGYGGEISFVDEQIGSLLNWLQSQNYEREWILVIAGDHGESLGEHQEATHGFFTYNSTLKIPMILRYSSAPAGKVILENSATVDLVPTVLSLLGIPDPLKRDGESLLPLINGEKRKRDIYFESRYPELLGWNGLQGLIHTRWKLISTTTPELFDLQKDAVEKVNLFQSEHEIADLLMTDLARVAASEERTSSAADPETIEKLRSLGYVGSVSASQAGTDDPKDKIGVWSRYEKTLQLKSEGKKKEALSLLESIVQEERMNRFFRISLASFYREVGRSADAIRELEFAQKNNPSDENVYHELSLTHREVRNFQEALRAEDAAIALNPSRSEFYGTRASILVELGRFEDARDQFRKVREMDPNNAVAWNNYGNACREMGDLDEAAKAYGTAIELSPNYAYPHNGLATVLIRQKRSREAIPHLEKALALDSDYVEVYLNMGIAYHTLGEAEKARTLYRAFLKIAPDWMSLERENAKRLLASLS